MILRNSDRIQREFRPALLEAGDAVADYFGTRLRAIYLTGSVANGEAVPGHSDVDWFTFLDEAPSETDLAWCTELQQRLAARYPEAKDFHTTPHPLARLESDRFWRFAVRYIAVQLYGDDVLAELEARDITTDKPDVALAAARLPFMRRILADLGAGAVPAYVYPEPDDPRLAMRKLARYFVVVEGAYLLMAHGRFISFNTWDVLPALRADFPQWKRLYDITARVLRDPFAVTFSKVAYQQDVMSFFSWVIEEIASLAQVNCAGSPCP